MKVSVLITNYIFHVQIWLSPMHLFSRWPGVSKVFQAWSFTSIYMILCRIQLFSGYSVGLPWSRPFPFNCKVFIVLPLRQFSHAHLGAGKVMVRQLSCEDNICTLSAICSHSHIRESCLLVQFKISLLGAAFWSSCCSRAESQDLIFT